ncbi:MAG TPA: type 2 lanthipeptide synthetase LanM family protein, partial [Caldilineaceae bacterium]|nr:type 2 lanthipeptide synthetase LanM family protein [Caldilineaceae bacterium]
MAPSWFTSVTWRRALTLAERSATLPADPGPQLDSNAAVGRRRLQRWRAQPPFATDAYWMQRLAPHGLNEERLQLLLGEPAERLHARQPEPPEWLLELAEAYARPASVFAVPPPGEEALGLLDLIQPLIDRACDRLRAGVAALVAQWPALPFDPQTIEELLLVQLPEPLLMRLGRTLVLELNVARLQGHLEGETPEARFQSFVQRLRQPEEATAILAEYPVLARQLTLCVAQWVEVSLEFLNRLCADWEAIRRYFSQDSDPGLLVELIGGAGDTHRGGRSVMIVRFESGFRLVYKPKPLAVDVHFQELLAWLNRRGCEPPLRPLTILDRGAYGWVEYVEHQDCHTVGELERFYRRHGAYLALLYALNATDFHFENLIAAGEHPVLIDLETLFHPRFDTFDTAQADGVAEQLMANSVLQIGLLPQRLWSSDDYAGIDISGLGGAAGQLSPDRMPQLAGVGTDAMHYVRERVELPGDANRPTLNGVEANALDYAAEVVGGFVDMYRLLAKCRAELLASDGPLNRFAQDEIRVLLRPTRTYGQLLFESFHPDLLRDALERDLFLDRLWMAVPERPYMAAVVPSEQADLLHGDIPIFTAHPDSLDLFSASGETIRGALSESGMALVQHRLRQLDDQDMRRQLWLIRASLATLDFEGNHRAGTPSAAQGIYRAETERAASRGRLLAAIRDVADHLAATAIYGEHDVTWLGLGPLDQRNWAIAPLGIDLYAGVPGVALFLAYAGMVAQNEGYTALARRALNTVLQYGALLRTELTEIGGFEGWGGVLYTLTHLGTLWDDRTVLSEAEEIVEVIAGLVAQDDAFDVAHGAAGAIGALLAYHHCAPASKALQVAIACGEHLLAAAQPVKPGLGWTNLRFGGRPLAGFAHGAAGIAWALLELAAASGDQRYQVAAQQAIEYERSLYSPEAMNWPDLRQAESDGAASVPGSQPFMVAWCHGAAGIGLARLRAYQHLNDPHLAGEIHAALHTTLDKGFGQT